MHKPILASIMAAAIAATSVTALAQPGGGAYRRSPERGDSRYVPQPPPPGWDRENWRYRQQYEQRHPSQRRDWRRSDDNSEAMVAGILGFVLGAAIAGSQQDQERVRTKLTDKEWIAYCARKYRSFDAESGTYFGADGLRHYCR